jgi:hypothetical protein
VTSIVPSPIARSSPRILILSTIAILLAVVFVHDGIRLYEKTLREGRPNDFEMFWEGARRTLAGGDVLSVAGWGYPYLPTFYCVMAPLGLLPLGAAAVVWHVSKAGLLALALAAVVRLLDRLRAPGAEIAAAIAVLGVARALDSDLQLGQTNVAVLALVVLSAWAWLTHRDEVAGLSAALAALYKVTPAVFLAYFVWKRGWRAAAWGAVGLALFGGILPLAVFGAGETGRLYAGFHERLVAPQLESGSAPRMPDGSVPGQSLEPILARLLSRTPVESHVGEGAESSFTVNVASLDPFVVSRAAKALSLALVAAALLLSTPVPGEARRTRRALLELGLVAAVMLVASPYARKAHFVTLLLPFAAVASYAVETRSRGLIAAVVLAALLPGLSAPDLLGRELSERATAFGSFGAAAMVLAGASAVAIRRERAAERAAREAPAPRDLEISVFFPAYNEGENIGLVVERALDALSRCARRYEVIVVDDCSKDATPEVARALAGKHPDVVRHVRHEVNKRYGGAVKTGLASARYDYVFFSDGDGQFDLSELPEFVRPLGGTGVDAVIGYRRKRRDPFFRLVNAYCWGALVRTLFGIAARDIDCAFKVLPTRVVQRLDLRSTGALISTELLAKLDRAGVRWVERPVTHLPRERGTPTGANPKVILLAFLELWRLRGEIARFRLADVGPARDGGPALDGGRASG